MICMDKLTVIVPAAGAGKRLGLGKNKVFVMLGGLPLLVQCLRMINDTGMADKTIIAAGAAEIDAINEMLTRYRELFRCLIQQLWRAAQNAPTALKMRLP